MSPAMGELFSASGDLSRMGLQLGRDPFFQDCSFSGAGGYWGTAFPGMRRAEISLKLRMFLLNGLFPGIRCAAEIRGCVFGFLRPSAAGDREGAFSARDRVEFADRNLYICPGTAYGIRYMTYSA